MKAVTIAKLALCLASCGTLLGCATNDSLRFPAWFGSSEGKRADRPASPETGLAHQGQAGAKGMAEPDPADPIRFADTEHHHPGHNELASATETRLATGLMTLGPGQDLDQLILSAPGTVLLDFYADWCGPCKKQGQVLHQLEGTAASNNATIIKVNVDEHPRLQKQFQVSALPTLVVIKHGQIIHRQKGLTDRERLVSWLTN